MKKHPDPQSRQRARLNRRLATKSEGQLWATLRRWQLGGKKFRRQHPIGPWIVDFACIEYSLVIEIDGDYHDEVIESDLNRSDDLQRRGWRVIRFTAEDVETEIENVLVAIARELDGGGQNKQMRKPK